MCTLILLAGSVFAGETGFRDRAVFPPPDKIAAWARQYRLAPVRLQDSFVCKANREISAFLSVYDLEPNWKELLRCLRLAFQFHREYGSFLPVPPSDLKRN